MAIRRSRPLCVPKLRDGEELRDHFINGHSIDPRGSGYARYVQDVDVYPPTSKGSAKVAAGMPDG